MQKSLNFVVVGVALAMQSLAAWGGNREESDMSRKLFVGTKHSPPFAFKNPDGQWTGISIELWRHLTDELNLEYELREQTLNEIFSQLESGELDAAVAAISVTAERHQRVDFCHPHFTTGLGIAVSPKGHASHWLLMRRVVSSRLLTIVGVMISIVLVCETAPTEVICMPARITLGTTKRTNGVGPHDIAKQRADTRLISSVSSAPVGEAVEMMSKLIDVGSAFFKKQHPEVGARPGTLVIADDAPPPKIRIISYDEDAVQERDIHSAEELSAAFNPENVTWVDVQGFGDEELIRKVGEIFSIHPLAMEDVVNMPQRPKAETCEGQVLIITRMVRMKGRAEVDMEQVTVVLGENYVLTFQERYGDILDPVRKRIRTGKGRPIRRKNPGYLAYVIVDTIVDGYYPVIEALGDHLEQLEQVVMEEPSVQVLRVLNGTKNMLVNLRRAIWPQREAVNSLIRDENALISDEVRVFLRDTYDHCVQTAEVIEMYREMATGLMNTYISSVANRTNEVMKVLTIMASVFIPLTFLAGIYGMNFEHMPELHVRWAYPLVWITMLSVAFGMLGFFWRKGWIGRSVAKDHKSEPSSVERADRAG